MVALLRAINSVVTRFFFLRLVDRIAIFAYVSTEGAGNRGSGDLGLDVHRIEDLFGIDGADRIGGITICHWATIVVCSDAVATDSV